MHFEIRDLKMDRIQKSKFLLITCKIHHTAFDNKSFGVNPAYIIKVRTDILTETEGQMRKYGIKSPNNTNLILPVHKRDWSDKERLEYRYLDFAKAG